MIVNLTLLVFGASLLVIGAFAGMGAFALAGKIGKSDDVNESEDAESITVPVGTPAPTTIAQNNSEPLSTEEILRMVSNQNGN